MGSCLKAASGVTRPRTAGEPSLRWLNSVAHSDVKGARNRSDAGFTRCKYQMTTHAWAHGHRPCRQQARNELFSLVSTTHARYFAAAYWLHEKDVDQTHHMSFQAVMHYANHRLILVPVTEQIEARGLSCNLNELVILNKLNSLLFVRYKS